MSKFPVKSRSDVYHCAIHNLPTFRLWCGGGGGGGTSHLHFSAYPEIRHNSPVRKADPRHNPGYRFLDENSISVLSVVSGQLKNCTNQVVRASHIATSFLKVQKFQKAICTLRLRSKSIGKGASGRCFFDMLKSQHDLFPATLKEASSGSPFLRAVCSPWDWCRFFNMLKSQGVWYSATYVGTGPSG